MLIMKEILTGLLLCASVFFMIMEMKQDKWPREEPEGL
jgi:hypothetical protein